MRVQHDGAAAVERQNSGYQFGIGADHMRRGGNAEAFKVSAIKRISIAIISIRISLLTSTAPIVVENGENGVTEKSKADLRTVDC